MCIFIDNVDLGITDLDITTLDDDVLDASNPIDYTVIISVARVSLPYQNILLVNLNSK